MRRGLFTHAAAFLAWPLAQWAAARYGDRLHRRRILAAVVPITEGRLHS